MRHIPNGVEGYLLVEEVVEVAAAVDFVQAAIETRPGQTAQTVISRRVDVSASFLSRRRRLPSKVSGCGWLEVLVLAAMNQ